jgi:CBS domain-containing protein
MPTFETIASVMNSKGHKIWSVLPDAPVRHALALMARERIAAVLIVSEGRLLGILSAKDYVRRVVLEGKSQSDIRVREIMTSPVITVKPADDIVHCLEIMTRQRIRHLPVLDEDKLVGVVSMGDLGRAIISDQAFAIDQLKKYISQA